MSRKKNNKIKRFVSASVTILIVLFIFMQSCLPANTSSDESNNILELLNSITEFFGLGSIFTAHFVRKLAHFTEFSFLGASLRITLSLYNINRLKGFVFTALGCLFVAICDESIQLFSQGRACSLNDILLDFSGSLCVLALVTVCLWIKMKYSDNKPT